MIDHTTRCKNCGDGKKDHRNGKCNRAATGEGPIKKWEPWEPGEWEKLADAARPTPPSETIPKIPPMPLVDNPTIRYLLTIVDNGSEDKNIEITLTDLAGRMRTRNTVDSLIPALNHLKQTLCEDVEKIF